MNEIKIPLYKFLKYISIQIKFMRILSMMLLIMLLTSQIWSRTLEATQLSSIRPTTAQLASLTPHNELAVVKIKHLKILYTWAQTNRHVDF